MSRLTALSLLLWIAVAHPVAAQQPAATAPDGEKIFRQQCQSCHGKGGHGGWAPDLTSGGLAAPDREEQTFQTISKGIRGTDMAPYGERLQPAGIRAVIAYLRSLARAAAPLKGNAESGKTIFWGKGACANCHSVEGKGNLVGPDLSRAGSRRSADYLKESITDPSADVIDGFGGVTVLTRDGKTIRGIERSLDTFTVLLQDFTGKIYSFDIAAVRSVKEDKESLMPKYRSLSPAELDDLVAYLATLKRTAQP
jgi:putative heme-binding domain-containing protein